MICEKDMRLLLQKRLFLFDIDGTLALGDHLLEGTVELISLLRKMEKRIYFTSNNSTRSREEYAVYFIERGVNVRPEEIVTAGVLAQVFCREQMPGQRIFLLGVPELKRELEKNGLIVTEQYDENIDCLLVAFDTTLNYQKLESACRILHSKEVIYLATNPDLCCPTEYGAVPDCGSICAMLQNATGREPRFLGKPYPNIVDQCRKLSGASKDETVLVGDRIYTDMACADNAGVDGVLVLSGEADREDAVNCGIQIPYVLSNVRELYRILCEIELK